MPVIKSASSNRLLKEAVVLDLGDLDRQAKNILGDATEEARRIVEKAQQEAKKLIDSAAEIGRAAGMEQGLQAGREQGRSEAREAALAELAPQLKAIAAAWQQALDVWNEKREAMLLEAKHDVLALALELGQKVVFRILEVDETVIEDQLAEALSLLSGATSATVRINPEDRELVANALPEVLARLAPPGDVGRPHISLRIDPDMMRGGCVVTTEKGEIDARIEMQLSRIVDALLPPTSDEVMEPES
ncbi:MAG TPA: FliH/SctL family protein [Phycisphaerales bacterium]|nr:FliH/SctL family protein [Phycisphaerales bacterium]HRQ76156.1 FliH/SctL family protein [Phycisphaerales bacterium]